MTRLQEFAERVTREMIRADKEARNLAFAASGVLDPFEIPNKGAAAARAVLEREVRAFVLEGCPISWAHKTWLDSPTPTRSAETADPDPYCELAASEIPNFGTDRDKHRCAKLHSPTPTRSAETTADILKKHGQCACPECVAMYEGGVTTDE